MMGEYMIFEFKKIGLSKKVAFYATVIIGLFVHMYKFTNTLINHDSVWSFYSSQNAVQYGRWFLSLACGISSYTDLPWINGILSIVFVAITAAVIVDVFKIENLFLAALVGGLLVSYPAITNTFFYEYTADGYMLSMLLAALAVWFSIRERKMDLIIASILICFSCGIYQAYVSFALIILVFYFIFDVIRSGGAKRHERDFCG